MPKHQEYQAIHSEEYFLSFPDGSLSKKLLDFSYIEEKERSEELLTAQIVEKLYKFTDKALPHYYQGSYEPESYRNYIATEEGKKTIELITAELAIVFDVLGNWSKEQNLEVIGEQQEMRRVDTELVNFLIV